jgi:ribosomal-protein-alanine N-acetyltransferase
MMPTLFDPAQGDLAALAALHAQCFAEAWTAEALASLLTGPGTFVFHLPEGFVIARVAGDEAEILTIAVSPEARGQGLGRVLLRQAAGEAQTRGAQAMFLEVAADNAAARALYAGQGFEQVGGRKGYYNGRDALILKRPLPLPIPGEFA